MYKIGDKVITIKRMEYPYSDIPIGTEGTVAALAPGFDDDEQLMKISIGVFKYFWAAENEINHV